MSNEQEATAQHTPGPWTRPGADGFGIFAGHLCIASVHAARDENMAERKANAKLMAASPALLTVLHTIYDATHDPLIEEMAGKAIEAAS